MGCDLDRAGSARDGRIFSVSFPFQSETSLSLKPPSGQAESIDGEKSLLVQILDSSIRSKEFSPFPQKKVNGEF